MSKPKGTLYIFQHPDYMGTWQYKLWFTESEQGGHRIRKSHNFLYVAVGRPGALKGTWINETTNSIVSAEFMRYLFNIYELERKPYAPITGVWVYV